MAKPQTAPTTHWKHYLAALVQRERDQADQALSDLRHWLDLGGGPPSGFTHREILALVGILTERQRGIERTREVKAHQRQQRRYLGGIVPFGWRRDNGGLIEHPREQAAIALMVTSHARGMPSPAITELVERTHGIKLSRSVVYRIIQRAKKEQS